MRPSLDVPQYVMKSKLRVKG